MGKKFICTALIIAALMPGINIAVSAVNGKGDTLSVKQAVDNLKTTKGEYDQSYKEYQSLIAEKEQTESNIKALEEKIGGLESRINNSGTDGLKSKLDIASKNTAEKEKALQSAEIQLEQARAEYDKGSFGFFEYVGAYDALDVLNNCKYASYTNKGSETYATNLENMKASFDFIRECNSLRTQEGTDPTNGQTLGTLKVTDYMMATAQADANYSLTNIGHARQFDVGENLAWGYSDPFVGWYDREKQQYLSGISEFEVIGHYLNIVTSYYAVTGFAVAQGGSYGIEHAQTFTYLYANDARNVDEYEERFMDYYNRITGALAAAESSYENAETELSKAKSNEDSLKVDYYNLLAEAESMKKELSEKKSELSTLEKNLGNLSKEISLKKAELDEKEIAYKTAQSDYDKTIADNMGDTNLDGEMNIADALMISRYDAGLAELNEDQLAVSDVNNDGEVNIADALMISRFDAGLISEL